VLLGGTVGGFTAWTFAQRGSLPLRNTWGHGASKPVEWVPPRFFRGTWVKLGVVAGIVTFNSLYHVVHGSADSSPAPASHAAPASKAQPHSSQQAWPQPKPQHH